MQLATVVSDARIRDTFANQSSATNKNSLYDSYIRAIRWASDRIGDYLSREEKLTIIEEFQSIESIPWKRIIPNTEGDWINQRNPVFETFIELGKKIRDNHYIVNQDLSAYSFLGKN